MSVNGGAVNRRAGSCLVESGESGRFARRAIVLAGVSLLGACQLVPRTAPVPPPPPPRPDETAPQDGVLPSDSQRHRIALLVPMSGPNAGVGEAIANATTMALLDTAAQNLRITTYDTSAGAGQAAAHAVADGNKLILGPLLSDEVIAVASVARPARVPMITYSNDTGVASHDVFVLGTAPSQSVARVIGFAKASGVKRIAGLIPTGIFGQRASSALVTTARDEGMTVAGVETYDRSNTSIGGAVRRLTQSADFDAVLIADGPRLSMQAAPLVGDGAHILGTELWAGDAALTRSAALRGAWFAALSDARFPRFSATYKTRFGAVPPRIATLGYDSVLLTINVARTWRPGTVFPTAKLYDKGGFIGLDGVFRFRPNGVAERAMEVREVGAGTIKIVSPAPARFAD